MMSARRYTIALFVLIALILAAVAGFNRVVDPFWYYRDIEIPGFNAVKPRFARFERHVKPQLLVREQPGAIMLGSSFAEIGFDPLDAHFTDNGRLRGYNFAFAGAGWSIEECAFEYALRHTALRRVVLGISPGALPRADCSREFFDAQPLTKAQLLWSLKTLNNSLQTVAEQRRARPSHTREGRYVYARGAPGTARRFQEFFLRAAQGNSKCAAANLPATPPNAIADGPIEPGNLNLDGLRAVIRAARERNIELALVIYPRHTLSQELEIVCGDLRGRWGVMAAIARLVADEAPSGNVSLWTFDGYDDLRGERVTQAEPVLWQDPEHFNFELGTRMLEAIYAQTPSAFGTRLTPATADTAYRRMLEQRAAYLAAHPWFYDDLRVLTAPIAAVR